MSTVITIGTPVPNDILAKLCDLRRLGMSVNLIRVDLDAVRRGIAPSGRVLAADPVMIVIDDDEYHGYDLLYQPEEDENSQEQLRTEVIMEEVAEGCHAKIAEHVRKIWLNAPDCELIVVDGREASLRLSPDPDKVIESFSLPVV